MIRDDLNLGRKEATDVSIFEKTLFWVMTYFDNFLGKFFILFGNVTLNDYFNTLCLHLTLR